MFLSESTMPTNKNEPNWLSVMKIFKISTNQNQSHFDLVDILNVKANQDIY